MHSSPRTFVHFYNKDAALILARGASTLRQTCQFFWHSIESSSTRRNDFRRVHTQLLILPVNQQNQTTQTPAGSLKSRHPQPAPMHYCGVGAPREYPTCTCSRCGGHVHCRILSQTSDHSVCHDGQPAAECITAETQESESEEHPQTFHMRS